MRAGLAAMATAVLLLGAGSAAAQVQVRCSAPAVTSCSDQWHRSDVRIDWTVVPPFAALDGWCVDEVINWDTRGTVRACRAVSGGDEITRTITLRIDRTPPAITRQTPSRPPDHAGWYTRPVAFTVAATDQTSGVASCDPASYAGPDSAAAVVTASCRDVAGNTARRAFTVPFDATPPAVAALAAVPADEVVRLTWALAGASTVQVLRSPGRGGEAATVLHHGVGTSLVDRQVRNDRRYEYHVTAFDPAGNRATRTVAARPGPRLLSPLPRAQLADPPLLRWTKVRGARYYNVQLMRGGRKVLSAWPSRPRLQLERRWRYRGPRRLEPGQYRWMVWPGLGPRKRSEYGPRIGRRTFTVAP